MAIQTSYVGVFLRTINSDSNLLRGVRVTYSSNALCYAAGASIRGDYVTATPIPQSSPGDAFGMFGGKVPALAATAVNIGDPAYTAANGLFTNVSASAVYVGRWTGGTTGSNILGEVELESVQ
jgi:hypothetical protein